ncbi:hypothetical protein ACJMK2_031472, partial [Sinanodonta woodiana]
IAHEREVKGQVRLQFSDVSGKQCIVQRSMVATQKAKKIETRTLDGVITRRNAAGEKQSINSKCADLDKEMITYLGVAKPVLENVIFCHQEDSNWPLSEGKTLKEKFDAIFASTRYVKALENIRKLKQDQDGTLKMHKQDLQYLKLHKDKAAQLEENLKELEGRLAASMQSVEDIKIKLDPIEEKLDQIAKRSNEIYKVQTEITKLQSEKKQIDKNAKEIQESIENEFQGSDEALRRELAEFQDRVRERNETLKEYEGHQAELSQQLSKYNKEKSALLVEVGRLEHEAEGHAENIEKRDSFIRQYAEEYQFEGFERSDITDEKYKSFLENIRSKLDALINDTKCLKADYERKEDDLQKKMDELRDTKTKLEQNEKIKRDMVVCKISQSNV